MKFLSFLIAGILLQNSAFAVRCDTLLQLLEKQGRILAETRPETLALNKVAEWFTFESSLDRMGFRPEKRVIRATKKELQEILGQLSPVEVPAVAAEMRIYFSKISFHRVIDAFNLVRLRNALQVSPETILENYLEISRLFSSPQESNPARFLIPTEYGMNNDVILNITSLVITAQNKKIALPSYSELLGEIEASFPSARRWHQAQLFQSFLALQVSGKSENIQVFLKDVQELQSSLYLEGKTIGFFLPYPLTPTLEEALSLKLLATGAKLSLPEALSVLREIIRQQEPKSFRDLFEKFADLLQRAKVKEANAQKTEEARKNRKKHLIPILKEIREVQPTDLNSTPGS